VDRLAELAPEQLAGYGGLVAQGRVLLIGDAAHATTPQMASGACIAIEDAVVLGELLRANMPLGEALGAFMTRRYDRCRMVVENSLQIGEWQKHPGQPEADPARLARESQARLAQPI
jgi:2-polyprenyl-6-methoxyphenol hydroxylase-like FAD-dependent oxidoreductase